MVWAPCTSGPRRPPTSRPSPRSTTRGSRTGSRRSRRGPREPAEVAAWLDDPRPFLVAERDGRVAGFARVAPYSSRRAYATVGEHAVYVARSARGCGLGRLLLDELVAAAEAAGIHKLTSRVFADNAASRAVHRAAGFEEVGLQRRHARLDGEWRDCVLVERLLGDAAR